jgi:ribose transport system ATP-binding protein
MDLHVQRKTNQKKPVMSESKVLLSMRGIGKSFSGVRVLENVQLDVHAGEVHILPT